MLQWKVSLPMAGVGAGGALRSLPSQTRLGFWDSVRRWGWCLDPSLLCSSREGCSALLEAIASSIPALQGPSRASMLQAFLSGSLQAQVKGLGLRVLQAGRAPQRPVAALTVAAALQAAGRRIPLGCGPGTGAGGGTCSREAAGTRPAPLGVAAAAFRPRCFLHPSIAQALNGRCAVGRLQLP
uniref:Uncharacterized protein n=1 Tax=Amazona collaria TaxID=241587 RepID=A0A8B9G417_9PSIT